MKRCTSDEIADALRGELEGGRYRAGEFAVIVTEEVRVAEVCDEIALPYIVLNGYMKEFPNAKAVVREDQRTESVADALRRGLEKAGVQLAADGDPSLEFRLVGDGDFRHEAFAVATSAAGVTVKGNVLWGVYDFLERFLGARFYYAGDEGEVHPRVTDLTIGNRPVQQTWGYAIGNSYFPEAVAFNYETLP